MYPDDYDYLYLETRDINDFGKLSRKEQVAFCISILEMEVNNGGFDQFFTNSSGYFALEVLEALKEIHAFRTADILERAIGISYQNGYPRDRAKHQEVLSTDIEEALDEIDSAFYKYEDDLSTLVNKYLGQ